ncbi:MAG: Crp/Fnr family transcriptional regulator [Candidatus Omnitrophica bacterium]|nr:Crp/Fnr family transcriptional regulator [Candidatus Omnitrophota bacterium]
MKNERERFLRTVVPFDTLPPEEMGRVAELSFEKDFQKGETVFLEGTASHTVWIVKKGRVHLENFHPGGKVSTNCVMAEGELFCCLPALDRKSYPATAVAKTESKVVGIPSQLFSELMAKYPSFSQRALSFFCSRLREVEARGGCQTYESAERRVVSTLLMLEKKFGREIPLTREEIAELSGVTVETAIRMTSLLKKKRLIASEGKKSLKVDTEKLSAYLNSL